MPFHIVLNSPKNLTTASNGAKEKTNPRHAMVELQRELDAKVHDGTGLVPSLLDKLLGTVSRMSPVWWAIARKLRREVRPGDAIFCTGEDVGLPVAALCGGISDVHVTFMIHRIDSKKKHLAMKLFQANRKVAVFFAVSRLQMTSLQNYLGLGEDRVKFVWDQVDTNFFTPGAASPTKKRPVIASIGLEQRDYTTLANATHDLDVDVRISGFSLDTRTKSKAFPDAFPSNMTRQFYSWPELVQLYRDADVVVVTLFPNTYAAGVQGLMEALSCGRPVVLTVTDGLEEYRNNSSAIRLINPGDHVAMRAAILDLIANSSQKKSQALEARNIAETRHRSENYVSAIASTLKMLTQS